uniref:Uncharacterized protein n=1 Tax=Rhizophora mucronata TaxID=61149 RepID=A0A2P2KH21_RHIMU
MFSRCNFLPFERFDVFSLPFFLCLSFWFPHFFELFCPSRKVLLREK